MTETNAEFLGKHKKFRADSKKLATIVVIENYSYGFVLPETGGIGTLPLAIIGYALMAFPILYSIIRRKRERRFN